jgi:ABC-type phosphate transport system permease subunit
VVKSAAAVSILFILSIFVFITMKAWPVLKASGVSLITTNGFDQQVNDAFNSVAGQESYRFGLLGLIAGTGFTLSFALLFAAVLGVASAVVIVELLPTPLAIVCRALIRLLASIPSVIFGLLAVIAVVPFFASLTNDAMQERFVGQFQITGDGLGASAVVLLFMIAPTVVSLSIDALEAVPQHFREAGFAFGLSHFRVIRTIVLHNARSGIIASIVLAAGRGIGESIAVAMVCGGLGIIPNPAHGFVALVTPVLPLAPAIINKAEAMNRPAIEAVLFACAFVLLLSGSGLSLGAKLIESRMNKAAGI